VKKRKKAALIAKYDQCDITNSEIQYREENLSESEHLLEKIMEKLSNSDCSNYDRLNALYQSGKVDKLVKRLKSDKKIMEMVSDVISRYVYDDYDLFSICWDNERQCIDDEWAESGYCGYYKADDERGYKYDYSYYKCGSDLLTSVTSRNHYSDDFEMLREPEGCILFVIGSRNYRFVPIENEYLETIGNKCVFDYEENTIYKAVKFSNYDGDHMEFEAHKYDHAKRSFSSDVMVISERYLKANKENRACCMTLKEALHVKYVGDRLERLDDIGIDLSEMRTSLATAIPGLSDDHMNMHLVDRHDIPTNLTGMDLVESIAVLNIMKTGKRFIYGLPDTNDMKARMLSVLLSDDKNKMEILEEASAIRNELARAIGSSRASSKITALPAEEQIILKLAA